MHSRSTQTPTPRAQLEQRLAQTDDVRARIWARWLYWAEQLLAEERPSEVRHG